MKRYSPSFLSRLGFVSFVLYFVGMMFFILYLNPLLFSQEPLVRSLDGLSKVPLFTPPPVTLFNSPHKGDVSGLKDEILSSMPTPLSPSVGLNFRVEKILRLESEYPLSWKLVEGHVYLIYPRKIVVLDFQGLEQWSFSVRLQGESPELLTPSFTKESVFLASSSLGRIYSLDRDTGDLRWLTDLHQPILSSPILFKESLYVVVGSPQESYLVRTHRVSGKSEWLSAEGFSFDGGIWSHPDFEHLIVSGGGEVFALNSYNGEKMWRVSLDRSSRDLIVLGDRFYISKDGGEVLAFDNKTGQKIWVTNLDSDLGPIQYIPNERILVLMGSDRVIYALDAETGKKMWRLKLWGRSPVNVMTPVRLGLRRQREFQLGVGGWSIWSPCWQRSLCVLHPKTGRVLGRITVRGVVVSPPQFDGSSFFLVFRQDKESLSGEEPTWAFLHMKDD